MYLSTIDRAKSTGRPRLKAIGGTVVVAPDVHAADRRDLPEVLDEEVAVLWLQGDLTVGHRRPPP
ncbi:hypothetical protein ACFQ1S_01025, partial [Kibdelosporangium lantanae]